MPRNKRSIKTPAPKKPGFFINASVEAKYMPGAGLKPGQEVVVTALNWRSELCRITPKVADHIYSKGGGILVPR